MTSTDTAAIERACVEVVSSVLAEYRTRLVDAAVQGNKREIANTRHEDNFLSDFDMVLHEHYKEAFASRLPGFVYLSEEGEPEAIGDGSDLVVLVDPLDTSELAVRGLHGYTHVLVYSVAAARTVVAVVGDFFHQIDLYVGVDLGGERRAHLRTRDGREHTLASPTRHPSDRLLVTSYNMRPEERFLPLAGQSRLMSFLADGAAGAGVVGGPTGDHSRIGVDFGSVGLCHVASGATDVFLEFAKGFALWDLLPGQFILEAAGGVVCNLEGELLAWPTSAFADIGAMQTAMNTRQTFIAASDVNVAKAIAATLDPTLAPA